MLASAGYPASSSSGTSSRGLDEAAATGPVEITHAGTARRDDGAVVTAGGRVLNVTASGPGPLPPATPPMLPPTASSSTGRQKPRH